MKRQGHSITFSILILWILAGCSRGTLTSPQPSPDNPLTPSPEAQNTSAANRSFLGYSELHIYPDSGEIEVVPLRDVNLHLNVVGILNSTMGVSAVGVPSESNPSTGKFAFDITLKHPLTQTKFTGFDTMGILITPGSLVIGNLTLADYNDTRLLNADGYSRWFNPTEFTQPGMFGYTKGNLAPVPSVPLNATVNPYKYFADILAPTSSMSAVQNEPLTSSKGRGLFSAGKSNTRRYVIQFKMNPGPKVIYGYAVAASWKAPTVNPPVNIPGDFDINANIPEAFNVAVAPKLNAVYYDSESGTSGGILRMQVNVHDWQGIDAGDIKNQVDAVRFFSPDLFSGGVNGVFDSEQPTKAIYTANLTGLTPTHAGQSVLMTRVASKGGPSYNQGVGPAPSDNVSAFNAILIDVVDPDCSADSNNEFAEYLPFDLTKPTVDQLCGTTDAKDFFRFTIPPGFNLQGKLVLYANPEPTRLALFDKNEILIQEEFVSGGKAEINLDSLGLLPDIYYIRVFTQSLNKAFLYVLEAEASLIDSTPVAEKSIPNNLYMDTTWVHQDGTYAYAAGNYAFWIYDGSDISIPNLISVTKSIVIAKEPAIYFPYVYFISFISGSFQVDMLDISNPAAPVHHANVFSNGMPLYSIYLDQDYLYLGVDDGGTHKVLIMDYKTDPLSLSVIKPLIPVMNVPVSKIRISHHGGANKVLIARTEDWINWADITDPDSASFSLAVSWFSSYLYDFDEENGLIATVQKHTVDGTKVGYFQVTDFGLTTKGVTPTGDILYDHVNVDIRGNYTYAGNEGLYLSVIDNSDPNTPVVKTTYLFPMRIGKTSVLGNKMLGASPMNGLGFYQASEISWTISYWTLKIGVNQYFDPIFMGNYVVISQFSNEWNHSLVTLDISDPENPSIACYVPVTPQINRLVKHGNQIIGASTNKKLVWFNYYDPVIPSILTQINHDDDISGMTLASNRLYVTDWGSSMDIYDVSTTGTFTLVGSIATPAVIYGLKINGNALYAFSSNKIYVFDITNPIAPTLQNSYSAPDTVWGFSISGDYMYIVTASNVESVDISSPFVFAPVDSISLPVPSSFEGRVDGQYMYVPAIASSPNLVRIWPPTDLAWIGSFADVLNSHTYNVYKNNDYLYVTGSPYGYDIIKLAN